MQSVLGFVLKHRNSLSLSIGVLLARGEFGLFRLPQRLPLFGFGVSNCCRRIGGYAVEQFSDDEYECDFENQKVCTPHSLLVLCSYKLRLIFF